MHDPLVVVEIFSQPSDGRVVQSRVYRGNLVTLRIVSLDGVAILAVYPKINDNACCKGRSITYLALEVSHHRSKGGASKHYGNK